MVNEYSITVNGDKMGNVLAVNHTKCVAKIADELALTLSYASNPLTIVIEKVEPEYEYAVIYQGVHLGFHDYADTHTLLMGMLGCRDYILDEVINEQVYPANIEIVKRVVEQKGGGE